MIAMAGEYYGRTNIGVEDVTNPEFQKWLKELMGAVTDFSSASPTPPRTLPSSATAWATAARCWKATCCRTCRVFSTAGKTRCKIYYPDYVTWFDFPFAIWVGPETTALQKNAALEFQKLFAQPRTTAKGARLWPAPGQP